MKEATGELNMTVITVVAIAAVGLLFTLFVWPNIQANVMMSSACSNIDMNGNYKADNGGNNVDGEGTIECQAFQCTATYNGRTYTKNCKNS